MFELKPHFFVVSMLSFHLFYWLSVRMLLSERHLFLMLLKNKYSVLSHHEKQWQKTLTGAKNFVRMVRYIIGIALHIWEHF